MRGGVYAGRIETMSRSMAEVSREIRLAGVQLPGRKDEAKWNEAKKAAHKSYPEFDESEDRFWKVVETIYQQMGGT